MPDDEIDKCSRCGGSTDDFATVVMVHTPYTQYRFPHIDLCEECASALWEFLDEKRPDAEPDFVTELVDRDVLIHPRGELANRWVHDNICDDSNMYLYGGISIHAGLHPDGARRCAEFVAGQIARDGLRVARLDDCSNCPLD